MIAIEEKIDEINAISEDVNETFEAKVNSFLDDILTIKKDVIELTQLMGSVIDAFYSEHTPVEIFQEYLPKIKNSIKLATDYSNKLHKSHVYKGMKAEYRNFKWAIDNFKEMLDDIEFMYFSDDKKELDAYFEEKK